MFEKLMNWSSGCPIREDPPLHRFGSNAFFRGLWTGTIMSVIWQIIFLVLLP